MFYSLTNMMPQSEALQPLRLTKLVLYACACREWRAERAAWELGPPLHMQREHYRADSACQYRTIEIIRWGLKETHRGRLQMHNASHTENGLCAWNWTLRLSCWTPT